MRKSCVKVDVSGMTYVEAVKRKERYEANVKNDNQQQQQQQ